MKCGPSISDFCIGSPTIGKAFFTHIEDDLQAFLATADHYLDFLKGDLSIDGVVLTAQIKSSMKLLVGPPMARQELLHFTEVKNAASRAASRSGKPIKPKHRVIPILPELRAVIDATHIGEETYLVNAHGKPFQATSFGNSFRDWCDAAGLKQCSAHGLRKAGATIAAENGATATQLMAIYGWERLEQAELYTRAANRTRVAKDAMHLVVPRPL